MTTELLAISMTIIHPFNCFYKVLQMHHTDGNNVVRGSCKQSPVLNTLHENSSLKTFSANFSFGMNN